MKTSIAFALAFIVLAAGVPALACGSPESKTDNDVHGCSSTAIAHQKQPSDWQRYPSGFSICGYMEASYYVSPSYPPGHRWLFYGSLDWRVQGGTWSYLYSPNHLSGDLDPGQALSVYDMYPIWGGCLGMGVPFSGTFEFRTHTQARLAKGDDQTNAVANDIVVCYGGF